MLITMARLLYVHMHDIVCVIVAICFYFSGLEKVVFIYNVV